MQVNFLTRDWAIKCQRPDGIKTYNYCMINDKCKYTLILLRPTFYSTTDLLQYIQQNAPYKYFCVMGYRKTLLTRHKLNRIYKQWDHEINQKQVVYLKPHNTYYP